MDYHNIRIETLRLLETGKQSVAMERVRFDGVCGKQSEEIIAKINIMDNFANAKAEELHLDSLKARKQLMLLLGLCVLGISILSSSILTRLKKNIIHPLNELTSAADNFEQGKPTIAISYKSSNELGTLANSFNLMTERIERDSEQKIRQEAQIYSAHEKISSQEELIKVQGDYYIEKQILEATLVSIGDGVISCDNNSNIVFMNKVAELLTGWKQEDAIGQSSEKIFNIANEKTHEKSENIIIKVLMSGKTAELCNHTILISNDGTERPIEDSAAPIFQKNGEIIGAVLVFRDVTDKQQKLSNIEFLSYHDELTGLYNRRFYENEIMRLDIARNLPLTIIMGDVNGLKLVNDSFGHSVGDELLKKVAGAIQKGCRAGDIVARLGGDEYIAILPKTEEEEADVIINRIQSILSKEKINDLDISISFGYGIKESMNQNMQDIFKDAEDNMYRQKIGESNSIKSKTIDLIMNTLYEKNPREQLHSKRVSEICEFIARSMDLNDDNIKQIKVAGLMHDIGKIGIDENVLNSPGKLNWSEWEEIKRHSEVGYRILSSCAEFTEIAKSVLEHHERWDGSGYPNGMSGDSISVTARIIAIADSYDAMIGERTYRESLCVEDALEEIKRCAGTQFDPEIVDTFIKHFDTKSVLGLPINEESSN